MISGLDLLFLEVNSLEESLAFYAGVLGMEVESINNDSEPPMAKLRGIAKLGAGLVRDGHVVLSHCGMGFNPLALYAVADRLSQSERNWQPFRKDGWKALVFPS